MEMVHKRILLFFFINFFTFGFSNYYYSLQDINPSSHTQTHGIIISPEYFSGQIIDMMAPTNFFGTNPDALERAFLTKITVKVLGYLLGDGVNDEAPKIITKETIVEVKLVRERTIVGDEKPWESDNDNYRDF